jgi:hypothetical protein
VASKYKLATVVIRRGRRRGSGKRLACDSRATVVQRQGSPGGVQGVAGNKKGEFEAEAQFLSKLHTKNGSNLLKLLLKGTENEAQFLKVTVSYCP